MLTVYNLNTSKSYNLLFKGYSAQNEYVMDGENIFNKNAHSLEILYGFDV